ncbi:MAG: hypothetical protein RR955_05510 [Raoultibacter sp.]
MADRVVENESTEVPEIDETLEKVLLYVLEEARSKMEAGDEVVPFTALVVKDNLFIESHPGESAEECFAFARHTVEGAAGAHAYAFCYDGYIETDDGTKDAIIAEGGLAGEEDGVAIGYLYAMEGEEPVFETEPAYVGESPNFMDALKQPTDEEAEAFEAANDEQFDEADEAE